MAEKKRQANATLHEQQVKQRSFQHHNSAPADITVHGNGHLTISTEAQRVRKAKGRRPGYVALDLGLVGVTRVRFRAQNDRAQPAPNNEISGINIQAAHNTTKGDAKPE